ncbi:MAG: type II toxin-antitoxin system PemK/MazF family toxin [candidate division WS1 bacterium]|jgi:mRNA interferase MazF|nr:type II toxin-antitoxin system PemK/MazF family toxin [candidate division WS1 bacterium]
MIAPARGEVWYADLDPVRGHEQAGRRPVLVISATLFNEGPAGLVVVLPLTTRDRGIPLQVAIEPPEGGVPQRSLIKCEDIRSIDRGRLTRQIGAVSTETMVAVEERLRALLGM